MGAVALKTDGGGRLITLGRRALALLLSVGVIAADAATPSPKAAELRLFYCIHAKGSCDDPNDAFAASPREIATVAPKALATKDDFVGFVDLDETTLQFYVEANDVILIDMPVPALKGSYTGHLTRVEALRLIARLSSPLARYRSQLKLKFVRWH